MDRINTRQTIEYQKAFSAGYSEGIMSCHEELLKMFELRMNRIVIVTNQSEIDRLKKENAELSEKNCQTCGDAESCFDVNDKMTICKNNSYSKWISKHTAGKLAELKREFVKDLEGLLVCSLISKINQEVKDLIKKYKEEGNAKK